MNVLKVLLAMTMIFAGTLQATLIVFTNNSKHRTEVGAQNWGINGSYNTGLIVFNEKQYPWNMHWAKDICARPQRAIEPGEKGDVYTTEGIIKITYNPSDKVKVVGKQGEEYMSGQDIDIPKDAIWELEIQDK